MRSKLLFMRSKLHGRLTPDRQCYAGLWNLRLT